ncbi:hypothetical protein DS2_03160 [Catenovulum agarivorans DS-2]|uniref:II family cellulose-binding protein n=1 Tax=Catenovulum agarivorans DS-2 TaxID=1328313 RepID=W7QFT9_9ALTE|nr:DUF2721 domain-containing protein [Catenovulum agarivorans]EWH11789.1 hypothetical protein DS2_03160 [Catenovulum agarivorans DS-2]
MSQIDITSPLLLFPAISLLLLAYTNRFIVIAGLTRSLSQQYEETHDDSMFAQIKHLRLRIRLIRHKQLWGVVSFLLCTLSMLCNITNYLAVGGLLFAASLVTLVVSLLICFVEIYISGYALNVQLENLGKRGS